MTTEPKLLASLHSLGVWARSGIDNSFQGADALVDEIRRKGDAVHFVLRYKGEDVIARFNIAWTDLFAPSRMGMPLIATVSCYAARAIPSAAVRDM